MIGEVLQPTLREVERFWAKVEQGDGCWRWLAAVDERGYGLFQLGQRRGVHRTVRAHRLAYELLVGSIPTDLTLDHLCRVTGCVNPTHMEVVTRAENARRALLVRRPRPLGLIAHGTERGHAAHRRRSEPPCRRCLDGHAEYVRSRKRAAV